MGDSLGDPKDLHKEKPQQTSSLWWGVAAIALISSTLWIDAARRSTRHLEAAQAWESQGDIQLALRHYQWAARSYTPWSSDPERAMHRMWSLAQQLELNEPTRALEAYELMRGAIWSTRWLNEPYRAWSTRVDEQILKARATPETHDALAQALKADPRPPITQSLSLLLSTVAALGVLISLLRRGLTRDLKVTPYTLRLTLLFALTLTWFYLSLKYGVS